MIRGMMTAAATAALICVTAVGSVAAAPGSLVLARGGQTPLYIWDASNVIARAVGGSDDSDHVMRTIASHALDAVAEKLPARGDAKEITVSVIYAKTAAVNPAYGTATMESVERLMTIVCNGKTLSQRGMRAAAQDAAAGRTTNGVQLKVTGALPPLH